MSARQAGNAVVMILVAVFLFGLLAATFMRSAKTGQGNMSTQQARLAAQQIFDYSSKFERVFNKLRQNGCSIDEIGYYIPGDIRFQDYGSAPPNECNILNSDGGNLNAPTFYADGLLERDLPWWNLYVGGDFGYGWIDGVGTTDATVNSKDFVFFVRGVKKPICESINQALKITVDLTTARWANFWFVPYPRDYTGNTYIMSGDLAGKNAACYFEGNDGSSADNYVYYQVIYER